MLDEQVSLICAELNVKPEDIRPILKYLLGRGWLPPRRPNTREIIENLLKQGYTRKQAASHSGLSYGTVCKHVHRLVEEGVIPKPRKQYNRTNERQSQELEERNEKIIQDLEAGRTLKEIGREHGITRERVRQIAKRAGVRSSYVQRRMEEKEPLVELVLELMRADDRLSFNNACKQVGISSTTVERHRGKELKEIIDERLKRKEKKVKAVVQLVKGGMSITKANKAVGGYKISNERLGAILAERGVESKRGRWTKKGMSRAAKIVKKRQASL